MAMAQGIVLWWCYSELGVYGCVVHIPNIIHGDCFVNAISVTTDIVHNTVVYGTDIYTSYTVHQFGRTSVRKTKCIIILKSLHYISILY